MSNPHGLVDEQTALLDEMRSDEVMAGIALGLQNQEPAIVALTKMVKYLTGRLLEVSKE